MGSAVCLLLGVLLQCALICESSAARKNVRQPRRALLRS